MGEVHQAGDPEDERQPDRCEGDQEPDLEPADRSVQDALPGRVDLDERLATDLQLELPLADIIDDREKLEKLGVQLDVVQGAIEIRAKIMTLTGEIVVI